MAKWNKDTKRPPHTHDLRNRYWGHDYSFTPLDPKGIKAKIVGWNSDGLNVKDYLILDDGKGGSTRYQIDKIRFESDPADMFWAEVTFAPRPAAPIEV